MNTLTPGEARIIRNSKRAACFAVGGTLLCSVSILSNADFYGLYGKLFLIVMWIADYIVLTANLATNQRVILLSGLLARRDFVTVARVCAVPMSLHVLALLVFDNPYRLYGIRPPRY